MKKSCWETGSVTEFTAEKCTDWKWETWNKNDQRTEIGCEKIFKKNSVKIKFTKWSAASSEMTTR